MKAKELAKILLENPEAEVCTSIVDDEIGEKYNHWSVERTEIAEDDYVDDYGLVAHGKIVKLYI